MKKILTMTVIVICLTLSTTFTVRSQSKEENQIDGVYLEQLESAYVQNVRETLEEYDVYDSGVTMTKIIYENGNIDYSVTIHNSRLSRLDQSEWAMMETDLNNLCFSQQGLHITYHFGGM